MPPIYGDQDGFEDYVEGWVTDDAAALGRLLERAERDIDRLLAGVPDDVTGRKLDPTLLAPYEREALAAAVYAQAEYRYLTGEEALAGKTSAPLKRVKGPDFEKEYAVDASSGSPRRYGPKVREELDAISHLRTLGARARA